MIEQFRNETIESVNTEVRQDVPMDQFQGVVPAKGAAVPVNKSGSFSPESIMPDFYSPDGQTVAGK